MAACSSCGAELDRPFAFCPNCGAATGDAPTATSPPPPAGEPRSTPSRPPSTASSDSFDHGRFAPGTLVGSRYRIVGRLGAGGMGEVYRADDLELGQSVALKFLSEAMESDTGRLERFLAEVRTARQVAHPNVCRVYDVGEIDGRRFLSMEYVDGEDLASLLRRIGRLPEDKGVELARQMAAGLAAMHDAGVLHRDLKPANVMIDGRGRARLTDFGLATDLERAAREKEFAGTPAYMAPEQLVGEPLTVQTDLYALGLVLHELFTGERYHKGARQPGTEEPRTTSATAGTGTSAPLNPAITKVIERCLEKEPARRPASALAVAAALPGGDPLAAALAAGETPSPQMVADAGAEGQLRPAVAVPLLAALLVSFVAFAWLNTRLVYQSYVEFPHSPDVLITKAEEMLARLGYPDAAANTAHGFQRTTAYSAWHAERDDALDRWETLDQANPPEVLFWHRTSPRTIGPTGFFSHGAGGGLVVTPTDPPFTRPGMTMLMLHPDGRLAYFEARPPDREEAADGDVPEPDWSALFAEAGLDMAVFAPAEPEWLGGSFADTRAAWVGPGADASGGELRVEAAAYRGRPVFFDLIAPWTTPLSSAPSPISTSQTINNIVGISLLFGLFTTAVGLAIRNARLGRADRQGAVRLAIAMGGLVLAATLLGSSYATWLTTLFMLVPWACFIGVLAWTFYTAVEPYVRRRWPQALISWTRLLGGRWRDPLVGRDLLLGSVLGLTGSIVGGLSVFVTDWRGVPPSAPSFAATEWSGPLDAVGSQLDSLQNAAVFGLGLLLLLVMFRILLRSERLAALGFVALFTGLAALQGTDLLVSLVIGIPTFLLLVVVVTRLGLVALVAFMFVGGGSASSLIAFTTPEFMRGPLVIVIATSLSLPLFGFFTSLSGRKAAAAKLLDD